MKRILLTAIFSLIALPANAGIIRVIENGKNAIYITKLAPLSQITILEKREYTSSKKPNLCGIVKAYKPAGGWQGLRINDVSININNLPVIETTCRKGELTKKVTSNYTDKDGNVYVIKLPKNTEVSITIPKLYRREGKTNGCGFVRFTITQSNHLIISGKTYNLGNIPQQKYNPLCINKGTKEKPIYVKYNPEV